MTATPPADVTLVPRRNFETGLAHKEAGNSLFVAADYQGAIREYNLAILYLSGLDASALASILPHPSEHSPQPFSQQQKNDIASAITACHLNMAATYIKLSKFQKAVVFADKAIKANSGNPKAYFRKAQALFALKELEPAQVAVRTAVKLTPNDPKIRELLDQIKAENTALEQKSTAELRANLKF